MPERLDDAQLEMYLQGISNPSVPSGCFLVSKRSNEMGCVHWIGDRWQFDVLTHLTIQQASFLALAANTYLMRVGRFADIDRNLHQDLPLEPLVTAEAVEVQAWLDSIRGNRQRLRYFATYAAGLKSWRLMTTSLVRKRLRETSQRQLEEGIALFFATAANQLIASLEHDSAEL